MTSTNNAAQPAIGADTIDRIDEVFTAAYKQDLAPGIAYGVVIGSDVVHSGGLGTVAVGDGAEAGDAAVPTADSVFRIASMTKSFTAAAALLLRDDGLLRLDEPIETYVPELASLALPTSDSPALTARSLLTMSGGLPTDDPWADRQESMSPGGLSELLAGGLCLTGAPGTAFEYANLGYVIVGRAITNITGQSVRDVIGERLLVPMGMTATCFDIADVAAQSLAIGHHRDGDGWVAESFSGPGEFSPLGGLFSSVNDLARWVAGFIDAFPPRSAADDRHPVSRATRREMQQMHRFADVIAPRPRDGSPVSSSAARAAGYGFGLKVEHDSRWGTVAGHSGGYPGFGSHMRWHAASGVGVVVLGNARYYPAAVPARAALEILLESVHAPAGRVARWPRTIELRGLVTKLVRAWDNDLADQIFADNMDLDTPREQRRTEIAEVFDQLGPVIDDGFANTESLNAAEALWWITGENGRVQVDIQLTPHRVPLVQTLGVEFVGSASVALQAAVDAATTSLTDVVGRGAVEVDCIEWVSADEATFRLRSADTEWKLVIAVDPATGDIVEHTLTVEPQSVDRFVRSSDG